jgi:hypothetical protein
MTIYPNNYNDEAVKKFIIDFFKASDTEPPLPKDGADPYVTAFEDDATLIMGLAEFVGAESISRWRQGAWSKVVSRRHIVDKVFVLNDNEVSMVGSVDYGLANGTSVNVEWSSHMVLNRPSRDLKLKYYHVYLDGSKLAQAVSAI